MTRKYNFLQGGGGEGLILFSTGQMRMFPKMSIFRQLENYDFKGKGGKFKIFNIEFLFLQIFDLRITKFIFCHQQATNVHKFING